jgi:septum formation protein
LDSLKKLNNYQIILGSQSPRRQFLLGELGIKFTVRTVPDENEDYPAHLVRDEIPVFLAKQKSRQLEKYVNENSILITADTIVWQNDGVLGKPEDIADAVRILKQLSGIKHTVYTGVCIKTAGKEKTFVAETDVFFRKLTDEEILFYIEKYKPFDKAGAYGAQEWIGYVGIEHIEGSYFNVMGLPVQKLYCELMDFIK